MLVLIINSISIQPNSYFLNFAISSQAKIKKYSSQVPFSSPQWDTSEYWWCLIHDSIRIVPLGLLNIFTLFSLSSRFSSTQRLADRDHYENPYNWTRGPPEQDHLQTVSWSKVVFSLPITRCSRSALSVSFCLLSPTKGALRVQGFRYQQRCLRFRQHFEAFDRMWTMFLHVFLSLCHTFAKLMHISVDYKMRC